MAAYWHIQPSQVYDNKSFTWHWYAIGLNYTTTIYFL